MAINAGHSSAFIARKATEVGWHHKAVYLATKSNNKGGNNNGIELEDIGDQDEDMGLFLLCPVKKGETLLYFGGKVCSIRSHLLTQFYM